MTPSPRWNRADIEARLPHAGRMCLLNTVVSCGPQGIDCLATNHADPTHPLRLNGQLPASAAIEYAAQATALHAADLAGPQAAPVPGFLASARKVELRVGRLDDQEGALRIQAHCLAAMSDQASYEFTVHNQQGELLAQGRVSVVLNRTLSAGRVEGKAAR